MVEKIIDHAPYVLLIGMPVAVGALLIAAL